jgi:hypothetical protein
MLSGRLIGAGEHRSGQLGGHLAMLCVGPSTARCRGVRGAGLVVSEKRNQYTIPPERQRRILVILVAALGRRVARCT